MISINISPEIFHSQKVGGISRYFSELMKSKGNNISFSCPILFGNNQYIPGRWSLSENKYVSKPQRLINNAYYRSLSSDIRHLSYFDFDCYSASSKNIITVYDFIHEKFGVDGQDSKIIARKQACIEKADKIISISQTTSQDLIDLYGVSQEKIETIYLGIDIDSEISESEQLVDDERPYMLFVGGRSGYKNFSTLLKAYSSSLFRTNGGRLVAFGSPPTVQELTEIQKLRLGKDEVLFVQGDDELLASYYKSAFLHIVPSLYEGFGLTPFESIGLGCTTIVHCNKVFQELFSPYGFVFDLSDPNVICEFIDNYPLSNVLEENKRFYLDNISRFTWDNVRKNTIKLYQGL